MRSLKLVAILVAGPLFSSCMGAGMNMGGMGNMDGSPAIVERPPSNAPWDVARASDINASPAVVEVELEARVAQIALLDGRFTTLWTYNGVLPGPVIEANVGDEIIVHFINRLPEDTTIHWHGVRLPVEMDGIQNRVPPGGTFDYRFIARDAGTFWYHPHVRSEDQVRRGLYGVLRINGPLDGALPPGKPVVLSDALVDSQGNLTAPTGMMTEMTGAQGNLLLVNGVLRPTLNVRAGEKVRLQFINAAASRYFRLVLPGHTLTLVGEDGAWLERPTPTQELLLTPGQRADVVIEATGLPGATLDLLSLPYDRSHASGSGASSNLLRVRYSSDPAITTAALPQALAAIPELTGGSASRIIRLAESMNMSGVTFTINGRAFPDVPLITSRRMAEETWDIVNESAMDHPFHLHGFFFQVVQVGAQPAGHRAWRDTVNVPSNTTVRIKVSLDGFPGRWMYHCHILGHAERGMMAELQVAP